MYVSRRSIKLHIYHTLADAVEEDRVSTDQKTGELIGSAVDNTYHTENIENCYHY